MSTATQERKTITENNIHTLSDKELDSAFDNDVISRDLYRSETRRRARAEAKEDYADELSPRIWYPKDKSGNYTREKVVMLTCGRNKNITMKWIRKIVESDLLKQYAAMSDEQVIAALEMKDAPPWESPAV